MAARLDGKKAIVTGGSRGIGAAIAQRLAVEGADVALTYAHNESAAQAVVAQIQHAGRKGVAVQADAADPAASARGVVEAADALGGVDILVHNAGIAGFAPLHETDFDEFRRQFSVNVDGVYAATRALTERIADGGRIVVIGSVNGDTVPVPGLATYSATKSAVAGLVRGWARDLGPRGILVNTVQPGPIDTDMNPADGALAGMMTPRIALGRYVRGDEVAALVAFLASDDASFITGAAIDIDGGFSA